MKYLTEIDLNKGHKSTHPDIKTDGTFYLVKIDGQAHGGRFRKVWFGLSFYPWVNGVGIQFDTPGTNRSRWEAVWEVHTDFLFGGVKD